MSRSSPPMISSRSFIVLGIITFFIVLFQTADHSTVIIAASPLLKSFHFLKNFLELNQMQ